MPITHIFLGGHDLEMLAIKELLLGKPDVVLHDLGLVWGAKASAYLCGISSALERGEHVLLIELEDDLPDAISRDLIQFIDHHGSRAGHDQLTSLEQVFRYFAFPAEQWSREMALIAANDRAHIAGMLELGATATEIRDIRLRDRAAQGITATEEYQGELAARQAVRHQHITVVHLPHTRTATVTDRLDSAMGGPGYTNLIILSPSQTMFFGFGSYIESLRTKYPASWFGGDLPKRGYWGIARVIAEDELLNLLGDKPHD